jgi:hypothetical protein
MDIRSLYFGKASAENEVATDPDRFLLTYLDRWNVPDQIDTQGKFLVLGPKGSGKSAAANYVGLTWSKKFGDHAVFRTTVDFDELNRTQSPLYSLDKKLVSQEVTALTDSAWKLFIGIRILESLAQDNACNLGRDPQLLRLLNDLKSAGLTSDDYPQVLRKVREKKGTFSIPKIVSGEVKSTETDSLSPGQLGDAIVGLVTNSSTPNRHILAIDGLDKAIGENDAYWRTLAALVRVGDVVTRRLRESGNNSVHLIIMCRTDVFRRISFADSAKIAADSGIHISWGAEMQNPREVALWEYVAQKAQVDPDELIATLPEFLKVGRGRGKNITSTQYVLQFTRYTPRDMSLLFTAVQGRVRHSGQVTAEQLRAGADSFATSYLLPEITSEAAGLLPSEVIGRLPRMLNSLPATVFDRDDLTKAMTEVQISDLVTPDDLGEYLFLQGAIGNFRPQVRYVQFYHRRDTYDFNPRGPWILHTGLAYALNIPFSGS